MGTFRQHYKFLRSDVPDKVPAPELIEYGELAINYSQGKERLYIKNASNTMVPFLSEQESKVYVDSKMSFFYGHNIVTTSVGIPLNKRFVLCNVGGNDSFSLASVPEDGRDIHVIIKNTSASTIVISLPTKAPYVPVDSDVLTILSGKTKEVNALSDGTSIYLHTN